MVPGELLVQGFIKATKSVLTSICGEAEICHEILPHKKESIRGDVIGVMGISGDVTGTTILVFPTDIAETVVSAMTGFDLDELSEADINDGVAEALNMICGNCKTIVAESDYSFSLALPTIFSSSEYKIGYHHEAEVVGIRFDALGKSFFLWISFEHESTGQQTVEVGEVSPV